MSITALARGMKGTRSMKWQDHRGNTFMIDQSYLRCRRRQMPFTNQLKYSVPSTCPSVMATSLNRFGCCSLGFSTSPRGAHRMWGPGRCFFPLSPLLQIRLKCFWQRKAEKPDIYPLKVVVRCSRCTHESATVIRNEVKAGNYRGAAAKERPIGVCVWGGGHWVQQQMVQGPL